MTNVAGLSRVSPNSVCLGCYYFYNYGSSVIEDVFNPFSRGMCGISRSNKRTKKRDMAGVGSF